MLNEFRSLMTWAERWSDLAICARIRIHLDKIPNDLDSLIFPQRYFRVTYLPLDLKGASVSDFVPTRRLVRSAEPKS